MNHPDERLRRSNIYWTVFERLSTEARISGMWALEDMHKALIAVDAETAQFYTHFAGSKAREAFTFAIMALDYAARSTEGR